MGVGGQRHALAALARGKTWYPLYRRMGGPQGRPGRVRKISSPNGIRSPDHPVRSKSLRNAIKIITNGIELKDGGGGVCVENLDLTSKELTGRLKKIAK